MKSARYLTILLACAALLTTAAGDAGAQARPLTDAQVRERIVQQSIASYSGSCPCPYSVARNGSRCGGRSAYSRPGGASPRCYASDVSQAEVEAYRRRHGISRP